MFSTPLFPVGFTWKRAVEKDFGFSSLVTSSQKSPTKPVIL